MSIRRIGLGAVGGVVLATAVIVAMRYATPRLVSALRHEDVAGARIAVLWLLLAGLALGVVIAVSQKDPLICGLAGILILTFFSPLLTRTIVPSWSPDWYTVTLLTNDPSFSFIVAGTLLGAAGWQTLELVRSNR